MDAAPTAEVLTGERIESAHRGVFLLAAATAVMLCLGIAWCLPAGHGADEFGHMAYAGYVWDKGSVPGPKDLWVPQGVQHPFLYYAYVAAFRGMLGSASGSPSAGAVVLPYERRVVVDRRPMPDPMLPRAGAGVSERLVGGVWPYLWRMSGILPLAVILVLVFGTAWAVSGNRATATLAAAVAVLVPQLPATFATINNDQFAVLFSSAGLATVALGIARGSLSPLRVACAGLLFALGFLSKATVIGAAAAAAVLVLFFSRRSAGKCIRDLALLGAPSVVLAGWWYVARVLATGHADFGLMIGADHPEQMRVVPPDLFGCIETLAHAIRTSICFVGADTLTPGDFMVMVATAVPVMVVLGSLLVLGSKQASRIDRTVAGSFLAGVAVLLVFFIGATRYSGITQGRYLLTLVVPAALAGEVAARHLFGRQARKVLAAAVTWFGIMGIVLLHGQIIPRYHPPRDRFTSPDFVAYFDAGTLSAAPFVERGAPWWESSWAPRPEGSMIADPAEVRIRVPDLDPSGTYVAWLRVHPFARHVTAQESFADDLPIGGLITPLSVPGWLKLPIPRQATADGSVSISSKASIGGAVIAELLITRVPIQVEVPARTLGDAVRIRLTTTAAERLPPLRASLVGKDGGSSPPVGVTFAGGACDLRIPLPDGLRGPLQLHVHPPPSVWSDFKVVGLETPPAERAVSKDSPGLDVVRIPATAPAGAVVLRVPGLNLVPGHYVVEIVDEHGVSAPAGRLAIVWPDGARKDAAGAEFAITDPGSKGFVCEVAYSGGAPFLVDRIRLWHAEPWIYDLGSR